MIDIAITITSKAFQSLIVYAERYAIGRMTYAPHEFGEIVEKYLPEIHNSTLNVLINDIELQAQRECGLGEECDKKMWLALLDTLKNERDSRG